jgi:hypothetical protein
VGARAHIVVPRAMMLAVLMRTFPASGIAIAGTHGSTTTTASLVSSGASPKRRLDPTCRDRRQDQFTHRPPTPRPGQGEFRSPTDSPVRLAP